MVIYKYVVSLKDKTLTEKEWVVSFGKKATRYDVIRKFENLYGIPFGNDPKLYGIRALNRLNIT